MQIRRSHIFVAVIVVVVLGYFGLRTVMGGDKKAEAAPAKKGNEATLVQVALTPEQTRPYAVTVRGRTQAPRSVQVRAATAGVVSATPVLQGTFVKSGQLLCRQEVDARQASLDQSKAKLRSMELQYQASQQLQAKGFRSPTQVLAAKADLDQASASVRASEVNLEQMNIRAPFAGVFDHRDAEVGAYLSPGQPCGTVIELDPLLVVGDVSENDAARIRTGAQATAKLVDGQVIRGTVRYVAHDADATTRTYRVEIVARNPGAQVRAGLSADVRIEAGAGAAHLVPVTAIVLNADGRQGVRYVDDAGKVLFAPVKVIEETADGVWVSGLTGAVRVITVGQSYVNEGQKVRVAQR
ncbi:MAG: efflux RND transporter periplasmic adaptor subunit [Proteobacteria bacterium]|nr:efflux RND transporter periplasmic adaptor subunit [Pseudomonadota bacterium]